MRGPSIEARRSPMKEMILDYVRNEYLDEEDEDDIDLDENTPLISSGIVDSFSMVSLKTFLEKKFDIKLPDADATPEAFDTVASIMQIVNKHIAAKGA
jgi:acyl carrier protein/D-alanine--poly(phosphoribitol) ligase subunit 2